MRRVRLLLAGVAAGLGLSGCDAPAPPPAGATDASHATTGADDTTDATADDGADRSGRRENATDLLAFLRAIYGPRARLQGEWADASGRRRHVCARGGPRDREPWPSLLAVCADVPDCVGSGPGAVDFFALAGTGSGVRADALAREVATGANGCAGDVSVVRFGRERWGFLHSGGATSQGYLIAWTTLSAFRAGRLEDLATVNTTFDNNGATCEAEDCREVGMSINSDLRFDASDAQADVWPLVVHQSGVECFLNVERTRRYAFDAGRFRYPVPDGPPDVACPPVAIP